MMHDDSHGGGGSHVMYIFGYLLLRSNCSIFNLSCMTIVTVGGGGGAGSHVMYIFMVFATEK